MALMTSMIGPRGPLTISRAEMAERRRARRARRLNLRIYMLIWVGFFAYALSEFVMADSLAAAIDGYLPLQLAAGIAALAVLLCGRGLQAYTFSLWASRLPVAVTATALALTSLASISASMPEDDRPPPETATTGQPFPGPMIVSL